MESLFKIWKRNRKYYANFLKYTSLEELNNIPQGFNNNIIWNIGHVIAIQQKLIYDKAGLDMLISQDFFEKYQMGSKPTERVDQKVVEDMETLLWQCVEQTESDYNNDVFKQYQAWTTSTKFDIDSLDSAFVFNNYHEGLHLGYIMSIRKFN